MCGSPDNKRRLPARRAFPPYQVQLSRADDPLSDISPIRSLIEQLRRVRVMKYETKPQQTDQTSGYA
jgi:hypothetical protein